MLECIKYFQNATLHFNCEYNPEDSIESKDEHGVHLFTIIDVCLLPHPDADHSNVYHCETENMDYVSSFEPLTV